MGIELSQPRCKETLKGTLKGGVQSAAPGGAGGWQGGMGIELRQPQCLKILKATLKAGTQSALQHLLVPGGGTATVAGWDSHSIKSAEVLGQVSRRL